MREDIRKLKNLIQAYEDCPSSHTVQEEMRLWKMHCLKVHGVKVVTEAVIAAYRERYRL